jgi:predicted RNA polymerase sigma factor
MADGPRAGLALLDGLDDALAHSHRLGAVRAHLLELDGDLAGAREAYLAAARRATSLPEQQYLERRALACREHVAGSDLLP